MKISRHIGEHKFPFMHYETEVPNKNLVVVIHGLGEVGPSDGSTLTKTEQPNTYAKHASKGTEFPFNIVAPQLSGWNPVDMVNFVNHMARKYGYTKVFITGLSGGGELTWKMLDPVFTFIPEIVGIAPVAGKWREGVAKACTLRDIPIYVWHNIGDSIMPWSRERGGEELLVDALMKCTRKVYPITEIIPSSSHDAWTAAYAVGGKLQKFIEGLFGTPEVIKDEVISSYYDGVNLVFETKSGKIIKR
jgi:predicted esterase